MGGVGERRCCWRWEGTSFGSRPRCVRGRRTEGHGFFTSGPGRRRGGVWQPARRRRIVPWWRRPRDGRLWASWARMGIRLTSWRWCMRRSDEHTGPLSPRGDVFSFFHSHLSSHRASSLDRLQSALTPIFSTAAVVHAQNRGLDRLGWEKSMGQMEYSCQPRNDSRNTWYVPSRVLLASLNVRWVAVRAAFVCVTIDPASRRRG